MMLDKMDVCIQVLLSKTINYVSEYDDGIYWKLYFSKAYRDQFAAEPIFLELFDAIQSRIESRMRTELNLDPDEFKEK